MKFDSPLFDRIRVKPTAEARPANDAPVCEWPGCTHAGTHRAPKGRNRDNQYFRYCLDHVREYNQSYNFFKDMSDEFEGCDLDAAKWMVQGMDGEYRSEFIGRAPSQFSTKNVRVEDGKLKLQTRWEPDFHFSDEPDADGRKYENITTAAVISRKQFLYGYMEIKCKAADASITSSFWATGHRSELDVFEFIGSAAQAKKKHL